MFDNRGLVVNYFEIIYYKEYVNSLWRAKHDILLRHHSHKEDITEWASQNHFHIIVAYLQIQYRLAKITPLIKGLE